MREWKFLILACVLLVPCVAMGQPLLVDFYADWCAPCQEMKATVDQLAAAGYQVQRVNVDQDRELAARFGIVSIPTFIVVEQGREVDRIVGPTSVERLKLKLRKPSVKVEAKGHPHPAWRYEHPIGYRSAVVRIDCTMQKLPNGPTPHAWGSGVVVYWAGRTVILTAKHVIKGAVQIDVYLHTRRKIRAHVVAIETARECCAIQTDEAIAEIQPVEILDAVCTAGDRLESCGYGPDSRLASNTGIFQTYSGKVGDLMEVSGYVREGDSGGPVFDGHGNVAGIIWAGGGEQAVKAGIVAVESRTLRSFLLKYLPPINKFSYAAPDYSPVQCGPGGCLQYQRPQQYPNPAPAPDPVAGEDASLMPWRNKMEKKLGDIDKKIDALGNAQNQQPVLPPQAAPTPEAVPPTPKEPPGNAIEQKLDDFLHKLPIQGPITKLEEKQLESEHPLQRFFGANAAIIFLTLVGATVLGGIVLVAHKVYQAAHAHKTAIEAGLAKVPGIGPGLAAGFDKLDTANTGLDAKLQAAVTDIKGHITAVATPAPGQNIAPPVSVNVTPSP